MEGNRKPSCFSTTLLFSANESTLGPGGQLPVKQQLNRLDLRNPASLCRAVTWASLASLPYILAEFGNDPSLFYFFLRCGLNLPILDLVKMRLGHWSGWIYFCASHKVVGTSSYRFASQALLCTNILLMIL